jgi:hypothetical protein
MSPGTETETFETEKLQEKLMNASFINSKRAIPKIRKDIKYQ